MVHQVVHGSSPFSKYIPQLSFKNPLESRFELDFLNGWAGHFVYICRCEECKEKTFEDLLDDKVYNVVTSNYVLDGGDGYTMLEESKESHVIGDLDTDVIKA